MKKANEILHMIFISYSKFSEVLKPGKKPLNFPSSSIASKFATILGFRFFTPLAMRGYHFYTTIIKKGFIKAVTIICFIANQTIRSKFCKAIIYGLFNQRYFMGRSAFHVAETGKPEASAIAMILVPLPRFVLPTARPLFLPAQTSRL